MGAIIGFGEAPTATTWPVPAVGALAAAYAGGAKTAAAVARPSAAIVFFSIVIS
ncbi:hypothetical protein GCM10023195_56650 [Actinoallomurus liliacearum]|uniref:Uncharacterized protein n=1 Tax=Actinoallomurus liliacearum TaxID=1080073 RepID=A0ABP8TUG0_9ACTN